MEGGIILIKKIQKDDTARVSFAVVGVLILILGSFSAVYLASVNKEHVLDRIEESYLERMRSTTNLVHEEVKTQAYYMALSAVYTATQVLCDQKQITPIFNESFGTYINESFPRKENNYEIEIENFSIGIFFEALNTKEIVPANEQENQTLCGKGAEVESRTMKNDKAGEFNETQTITYYTLSGEMNYTVKDIKSSRFLRKSMDIERRVESAYPLLSSKLEALDVACEGSSMPIPRTVKYILTTLAQYRVLQGYGMGEAASAVLDLPDKGTSKIITTSDVELALNVALLLETAKLYRTYDEEALKAIDDNFQNLEDEDYDKISDTEMQRLVEEYVNNGTIDAADIIALYLGIQNKTLNIEAIIAQALNAIADQFILKYLDYFHLMDSMDNVFWGVQLLGDAIGAVCEAADDLIGFITGKSEDEENLNRLKEWVKKTLIDEAGLSDTQIMHDTKININGTTYTITLNKNGECWHWEDVDGDPSTPDEYVKHTWSTTVEYEIKTQSGDYEVDSLEKDILRKEKSKLWYDPNSESDFYDQKYGTSVNEIYSSLRNVVKAMVAEVVDVVSNLVDLDISAYKTLNFPDYLNPKDEISILEEIRDQVDCAVNTIKNYFSGEDGKKRVKNLIAQLVNEHAKAISELQNFIIENFDELADTDDNMKHAKQELAYDLIFCAEIKKISQVNGGEHPDCAPAEPFSDFEVKTRFEDSKAQDVENDIEYHVEQTYEQVKNEELSVENNGKDGKPLYIIGGLQNIIDRTSDTIIELLTSTVHDFGLIPMACEMVKLVSNDIIFDQEMANTKYLQYTKLNVPFEFWKDEQEIARNMGKIDQELLWVDQEPNYLFAGENLNIDISNPKGIHYTTVSGGNILLGPVVGALTSDPKETFRTRPFATNWDISITGKVNIKTRTESRLFLMDGTHDFTKANKTQDIDLSITVTVYSGWNLDGVNYELSNTLLGDIWEFLNQIWDYIVSIVGSVFDALTKLMESFINLLTKLISYVAEIIKLIMDTIQFFIDLIRDFIEFIMDTIIKDIIEIVANVIGEGFSIKVFGITFEIKGDMEAAKNQSADGDLFWVSTSAGIACVDLSFMLRFARYHKENDDLPHYDILLDGNIKVGDFDLNISVDPLMAINNYIVEGHGTSVPENGTGWGIEFFVPEVEEYKEAKWSLGDYCNGLNSIPIPFLGLKATVDAGFVIRYNEPKGDTIVINEFESNPEGEDEGKEWFEIFNPTEDDISNWSVSTANNSLICQNLSDLESESDGQYTVYFLPNETLENGEAQDPHSLGDGLILMDEEGNIIDETPISKDPDNGDQNTWQRRYDGSVIWEFKTGTKLEQNSQEEINVKNEITAALKASFQVAWEELQKKDLSLDAIIEFVQDWIHNFIEMVLILISHVVQKVYVFFDLMLEEATGSAGGGIRLTLGMDGDGIIALLRWLVDTIETFIYNICNPSNPEGYPNLPKSVPEHMHVRFEVYLFVGTPKVIKKISKDPPEECRLSIAVQANIPALVTLLGWDWGDWEIVFGVYLANFPSEAVSEVLGTSDDPNVDVDIWLLKARIYEIS